MERISNLDYKGYHAIIGFDADSLIITGRVEGIDDLITFESENAEDIINEFHNAVDDYLVFCKNVGKEPNIQKE